MISKEEQNSIYIRLNKGEEIFSSLYKIIEEYNIQSGWISGIGAICKVEIGSYNLKNKNYNKTKLVNHYELISLMGNISKKNEKPFLHIHIVMSDDKCQVYGGHLFSAEILATGEFFIKKTQTYINRKYDKNIGLPLWSFNNCEK